MALSMAFPCVPPADLGTKLRYRFVWKVDKKVAAAAVEIRKQFPIMAYVGHNGDGKSLCAHYDLLPTLAGIPWECTEPSHPHTRAGITSGFRVVLSTTRILDPATGEPHQHAVQITSYGQMLALAWHADILLDEVQGVADSQDHQSLPAPVRNVIAKLRARDATLKWTTPDFSNANKKLRTVTQGVVHCKGYRKVRIEGRLWRSAQLFRWALFDAKQFDEFNHSKANRLEPEAVQRFWRPGHVVNGVYDTHGQVVSLGVAVDGGTSCVGCGGARAKPKCTCPPDPEAVPDGVVEVVDPKTHARRRFVVTDEPVPA